ncbi:hypothetical protein HY213_02330 [Candidatus Peregrinibacteria bacterium]|nr:hypothetical protein [Candidatus Peregrinibacteria bacterium]
MKVEIVGENQEYVLRLAGTNSGVKFVIVRVTRELTARIFNPSSNQHVEMVGNQEEFLGAGFLEQGGSKIEWASVSCDWKFGRHSPDDPQEADALIDELRRSVCAALNPQAPGAP